MTVGQGPEGRLCSPPRRSSPSWSTRCRWRSTRRAGCGSPCGRRYPHWKPTEPMNDKLLILEDTNGDGKADKCTVVRRRPAQPDRLRVLERRRPRRPGARTCCSSRTPTATTRPTSASASLHGLDTADTHHTVEQLRARPGRRALLPGRHVPPHAGRNALRPADAARQRAASSATSRGRRSSTSTSATASPTRTATSSTAGARTSSIDGTGANPYHAAAVLRPPADFPHKHGRPPQVYQQRTRPCPGMEILSSRHFPRRRCRATCSSPTCIGFQGILRYKLDRRRRPASRARSSSRSLSVTRPELPPGGRARSARTARSTSSTGRTRSSATCSTTSATPAATATHGRIYRVTYEGRAAVEAGEDRRRADREAARPAEAPGGPRPLPRADRTGRPQDRRT